jgi:hypothetical protein
MTDRETVGGSCSMLSLLVLTRQGVTPRIFIDLSTSVLPQDEMQAILAAPPRVIDHEYGAWVNVPPQEADDDVLSTQNGRGEWAEFPHLLSVLLFARSMGADWVNFDADGADTIDGYPTFDW